MTTADQPAAPRLAAMTTDEAARRGAAGAVLAVPVGACEQHGPHLPLGTDAIVASALVEGLARARQDVVTAPPVAVGASGEHADFAGTLSIGREATELLLVELGRSATATFRHVLLVSAHGGNATAVAAAVRRLLGEGRDVRAWSPRFGGDAHAGRTETSLLLHLRPELVDLSRAVPGVTTPLSQLLPELVASGVAAVAPNGVLGDPTGASADEGARLLRAAVDQLAAVVADWPTADGRSRPPHAPAPAPARGAS